MSWVEESIDWIMDDLLTTASPQVRSATSRNSRRERADVGSDENSQNLELFQIDAGEHIQRYRSHSLETVKLEVDAPALWHCSLRKVAM